MADPKLDLKKTKERVARLEMVKARARMRTNQRIQMQIDEREMKQAEADAATKPATKEKGAK